MRVKDYTVSLQGLQPEMRKVLKAVDDVYNEYNKEAMITAGTEVTHDSDFIHSAGSLHPFGYALDFRNNYFSESQKEAVYDALVKKLDPDYDVVWHSTHFHIEYDPK